MKYVIENGCHLYSPQDEDESRLVFRDIREWLMFSVPFYVERGVRECEAIRDECWYPWTFMLPWMRPGNLPFVLLIDFALPTTFDDEPFLESRWSPHNRGDDTQALLLRIYQEQVNMHADPIDGRDLVRVLQQLGTAYYKETGRGKVWALTASRRGLRTSQTETGGDGLGRIIEGSEWLA